MPVDQIQLLVEAGAGNFEKGDKVMAYLLSEKGLTLAMVVAIIMLWTFRVLWRAF
ncbi:hypothetical protein TWF694_006429 [Orbilia ellipsospora]|uniref:Uncharacterized protein n=1 Tax=Orbilia ellipsospora TaxID=2528407 RepID=A0AAV9XKH2_9PEZI